MLSEFLTEGSTALRHLIAATISLIFNPYMFAITLFPIALYKDGNVWYAFLSVLSLAVFPLIAHFRGVRQGKVNWNIDERWKRPPLLFLSALGGFFGFLLLRFLGSYYIAIATLIYATTAFAVAICSYKIKVSVHTATAVTTAIIVAWSMGAFWGGIMGVIAVIVAWSRLILKAHKPVEVAEAYALSSLSAILVLALLRAIPL
ncbi:hypothetical protein IPA_08045 [Ignicoccus pacificus DSM 13166]|uniref:PAP2 superfamily protein n=1 Tax=Ignicoccus pacificus DSM 13166 TaxID=940294 RepID=A0A977KBV5_9CREN|nr:hypothetical protein IPA_08045 [Ignicoccus pacificus DSM 13166]